MVAEPVAPVTGTTADPPRPLVGERLQALLELAARRRLVGDDEHDAERQPVAREVDDHVAHRQPGVALQLADEVAPQPPGLRGRFRRDDDLVAGVDGEGVGGGVQRVGVADLAAGGCPPAP